MKIKVDKLEKLKRQLKNSLDETVTFDCRVFGTMKVTIGDFLETGVVSKKILKQAPGWHDDMLVYPVTKALMKLVKEGK
jgi:hypothetical protein